MAGLSKEAHDEIMDLVNANGGTIEPEELIDLASDPDSPCHGYFRWDDAEAAHNDRLNTARQLIRMVRVTIEVTDLGTTRMRVPALGRNPNTTGYATTQFLRRDRDLARESLTLEFDKLKRAAQRTVGLAIELELGRDAIATLEHLVDAIKVAAGRFI